MWRKARTSHVEGACVEVAWRKATGSAGNGACLEVAWHSASLTNATCVEAGLCTCDDGLVLVRDSKDPAGTVLVFDPADWVALVDAVCGGMFPDGVRIDGADYLLTGRAQSGGTGMLRYTAKEWLAFTDGCRRGEFSLDALRELREASGG